MNVATKHLFDLYVPSNNLFSLQKGEVNLDVVGKDRATNFFPF